MVALGAIASLKVERPESLNDPVIHRVPHVMTVYRLNLWRVLGKMPGEVL